MKYYKIRFTLNSKLRGSSDYIKDYRLKIPNDKLFWEEPKFIGSIYYEKIDFEPYLLDIELYASSKINDLIMEGGPVSGKLIVSGKLKTILEKYRKTGMQFFNFNIIKKAIIYDDYWLLNMYEFNQEYIDFSNSVIYYEKHSEDFNTSYNIEKIVLKVNNLSEFMEYIKKAQIKAEMVYVEKLSLNKNITDDFFALRYVSGSMYFVSEKLKQEIEDAGCTGIEFQPSELSFNEWLAPGGEREKVYGKT